MHCSFHFLNVFNGATSILSNISVTLRKSHKNVLWGLFGKLQIRARDVFETSQRYHGKDVFFEMFLRRLIDVTEKPSFLRCIWDVLKTSQKSRLFWDVSERSLRGLFEWRPDWNLSETSHAGCVRIKKLNLTISWSLRTFNHLKVGLVCFMYFFWRTKIFLIFSCDVKEQSHVQYMIGKYCSKLKLMFFFET